MTDTPDTTHQWLRDLRDYWPLLVGFTAIIGFLVSLKLGQAQGVERYHALRAEQDSVKAAVAHTNAKTDTLADNQRFMALVMCRMYEQTNPKRALPSKCEEIFHGWGY